MRLALHLPRDESQSRYLQLQTRGRHKNLTIDEQLDWAEIPHPTEEVPEKYRYPLDSFFRPLSLRRRKTMRGQPERISFDEIDTFARLKRIELTQWELETILALDDCFMDQFAKEVKE